MPSPPPVQLYPAEVLNQLVLEVNVDSSKFADQPWASKLIVSNIGPSGAIITGSIYESLMPLVPQSYAKLYGSYVLTEIVRRYAGFITLTFIQHQTAAQASTPWRITSSFGNHRWPPILLALAFIQDNTFQRSTNGAKAQKAAIVLGPSYYVREAFIPETNEGARFIEEEFYSDTPFIIPQYETPVATSISYDIPGARGTFPESLHPKIVIPATRSSSTVVIQGSASDIAGSIGGQVFPATNMEEWQPYVLSDQQKQENGAWRRTRVTVYPPEQPEVIIR